MSSSTITPSGSILPVNNEISIDSQISNSIKRDEDAPEVADGKRKRDEQEQNIRIRLKKFKRLNTKGLLDLETRKDMISNLEHIVALGNEIKYRTYRQHQYDQELQKNMQTRSESRVSSEEGTASNSRKRDNDIKQKVVGRLVHAEDARVYNRKLRNCFRVGKDTAPNLIIDRCKIASYVWPTKAYRDVNLEKKHLNRYWDEEYGDGIDNEDFARKYLMPKVEESSNNGVDSSEKQQSSTDDKMLKEILNQSWDRAVHLASSTLSYDKKWTPFERGERCNIRNPISKGQEEIVRNTTEVPVFKNVTRDSVEKIQPQSSRMKFARLMKEAQVKCKNLNIDYKPTVEEGFEGPYFYCKACDEHFLESDIDVDTHWYGDTKKKGCCWNLIDKERYDTINNVMKRETMSIIDSLLHFILIESKKRTDTIGEEEAKNNPLNYLDFLQFFDKLKGDSTHQTQKNGSNISNNQCKGLLDTVQIHPKLRPIPLNDDILKVVKARLMDRYSTLPRNGCN